MRKVLKDYITEITENPEKCSLQSLRAKGASAEANNGITDRLMSKQDQRFSEKARNRNIKDCVSTRLSVSKIMGLQDSNSMIKMREMNKYFLF